MGRQPATHHKAVAAVVTKGIAALPSGTVTAADEAVASASTAVADRRVCTGVEAGVRADVGEDTWQETAATVPGLRGKAAFFALLSPCVSLIEALVDGAAAKTGLELPA